MGGLKSTQIEMLKRLQFFTALFLFVPFAFAQKAEQFVSLNLCSDRLLIELAHPEQIAAQSSYSRNALMMLDKINHDQPIVEPTLTSLLPYLNTTVLINPTFYPQLSEKLKQLGVKVFPVTDPQTPEQLFDLILQIGELTGNNFYSKQLVEQLKLHNAHSKQAIVETLILSDTGVIDSNQQPYRTLLELSELNPMQTTITPQNFSLEKLLLSQPNQLVVLSDQYGYNERAELIKHPILQEMFKNRPIIQLPLKYSYCFDHGLWQGAEKIKQQIK